MSIKIKKKVPMYIAVQLENMDMRTWLPLPATQAQFDGAIGRIKGDCGCFSIKEYNCRVPAMSRGTLRRTSLSLVNYLAYRLNKLSDDEILKLCAICDSEYYFTLVGQYIDYTFQAHCYTLVPGATDEEALGWHHIKNPNSLKAGALLHEYIDRRKYGMRLSEAENGVFTAHGYLTSSIGWGLPPVERIVPQSLNLIGYLGEDLYADWNEYHKSQ